MDITKLKKWGFGGNVVLAKKLQQLVLEGRKTATTGLHKSTSQILPKVGDLAVIMNHEGKPFCIIEYTKITLIPFLDVTYEYITKEGEGDKDVESWRNSHRDFFLREYPDSFTEDSLVICEEFRVMKTLA